MRQHPACPSHMGHTSQPRVGIWGKRKRAEGSSQAHLGPD